MAQLPLNNSMRERAALAVVTEKFEKKREQALEKIKAQARLRQEKIRGAWTDFVKNGGMSEHVGFTESTYVEMPVSRTYRKISGVANNPTGYYQHLEVPLNRPLADTANAREASKEIGCIFLNRRIAEFIELDKQMHKCYTNVFRFLKQFRTYERALAEWSDLPRYLPREEKAAKGKAPGTALILSGQSLNVYLKTI